VVCDELERSEDLGNRGLGLDHLGSSWSLRNSCDVHFLTSLLGGVLGGIVLLDTLQEVFVAPGSANVLDADVHTLTELAVSHDLGNLDTDGRLSDVEDDTRSTVVELEGHTLLLGRVTDNVHVVASLERGQESGETGDTLGSVGLGEFIPGTGTLTEGVRHFVCLRFYLLLKSPKNENKLFCFFLSLFRIV